MKNKKLSKDMIKIMKIMSPYYLTVSNLSAKELEINKDESAVSIIPKDSLEFYPSEMGRYLEMMHIDLNKLKGKKTLTISRSTEESSLNVIFTQTEAIDYIFEKAKIKKPKDKKVAWIMALGLIHYGVGLPARLDKFFKSKYYKHYN